MACLQARRSSPVYHWLGYDLLRILSKSCWIFWFSPPVYSLPTPAVLDLDFIYSPLSFDIGLLTVLCLAPIAPHQL